MKKNLIFTILSVILPLCVCKTYAQGQGTPTVVSDYTEDFNRLPLGDQPLGFIVSSSWGHITDPLETGDSYVKYNVSTYSVSRDGHYVSDQRIQVPDQEGDYTTNYARFHDYLVTPKVSGTVSIDVYSMASYYTTKELSFYKVSEQNGKLAVGELIKKFTDDEGGGLANYAWSTVSVTLEDTSRVAIFANDVYIDNFHASLAEINYHPALTISNVSSPDYFDTDANGNIEINYKVSVKNTGDYDLDGDNYNGYKLQLLGVNEDSTVLAETAIDSPLEKDSVKDNIQLSAVLNSSTTYNKFVIRECISNSSVYAPDAKIVPYEPILTLLAGNDTLTSSSTQNYGIINTPTSKAITVVNDGAAPLNIESISANNGFSVSATPFTLGAHEDSTIIVTLNTDTVGEHDGSLNIESNGGNVSIPLSGTVVDPQVFFVNFEDGNEPNGFVGSSWYVSSANAKDGNKYCYAVGTYESSFTTPKLTVKDGESMSFDVQKRYYQGTLNVAYSADGQSWSPAISLGAKDMSQKEYKTFKITTIPAGTYYLKFTGRSLYLDNIYGYHLTSDKHWKIQSSDIPSVGNVGEAYTATATIENNSKTSDASGSYTVALNIGGKKVAEAPAKDFNSGTTETFNLSFIPNLPQRTKGVIVISNGSDSVATDSVDVSFAKDGILPDYNLKEYADNRFPSDIQGVNVVVERIFTPGKWTTICLPFTLSPDEIKSVFGESTVVAKFVKQDNINVNTMDFETTDSLKARYPYLIKPSEETVYPLFQNVNIQEGGAFAYDSYYNPELCNDLGFYGTLSPTHLFAYDYIFNDSTQKIELHPENMTEVQSMRGYFSYMGYDTTYPTIDFTVIDPVANGITAISGNGMSEADNSFIYTLAGAKVGKNVKALPSGVYIIKGKKVIIR